ncbi:hypothetical protein [Weissella sp. LMG 11983]|uniref:hypothetical protein n=1 Tax=Weissella sp. LMG 11983 TaxID=2987700 RepID=UPI0021F86939|nr:hypothetical protein [Weissella sp. LMG 11983]MCW0926701.1 hypothetical protein [Weissella sp. LMG 11983]
MMNRQSRKKNSILNSSLGLLTQGVMMVCQFIMQTVFIKTLGAEYLGLNGLFTNVLQFLALAELGIGGAITFSLYNPIANNDTPLIRSIMKLYKKVYTYIGLFILGGGIIISFFLNAFISGSTIQNMQMLFLLFLLNSAVSYFFAYRRTLLIADQRAYVDSMNQAIFKVIQVMLQTVFLVATHNYVFYLIIQIVVTVSSNFSIYAKTQKLYPFLKIRM